MTDETRGAFPDGLGKWVGAGAGMADVPPRTALAMLEMRTVSAGGAAADKALKTAQIQLASAHAVCPGKYLLVFAGGIAAVAAARDAVYADGAERVLDAFLLGSPHPGLLPALRRAVEWPETGAVGVLDTATAASCVTAADAAAKAARVTLLEIRLARGLCGKSFTVMSGGVAEVRAALDAGVAAIERSGAYLDSVLLPRPDEGLRAALRDI